MNKLQQAAIGALTVVAVGAFMVSQNTRVVHATGSAVAVQVTGTASTKDIDNPDLQPVQFNLFPHSSTTNTAAVYFPVPAGKELVIDYVSGQAQDTSHPCGLTLGTSVGGNFLSYIVYVNRTTTDAFNMPVKIYADPGTSVQAFSFQNPGATSNAATITCSGHYINVP